MQFENVQKIQKIEAKYTIMIPTQPNSNEIKKNLYAMKHTNSLTHQYKRKKSDCTNE